MILRGSHLEELTAIANHNLIVQVSKRIFPVAQAVACVQHQLEAIARTGSVSLMTFS
jgi:hypothetical protein